MKAKRGIALGVAALMALGIFSGCGPGETASGEGASSESAGNTLADQLRADLALDGQEIIFVYPPGYGYLDPEGKDPYYRRRNERMAEVGEKYNCTITQKEGKGLYWQMMVTSILSGEPEGHVMITNPASFMGWYKANAFADLTAAMEKTGIDFTDKRYSQRVRKLASLDGKTLAFGERSVYNRNFAWYYNKRIFQEMKLEDPNELTEKGEWTWDKVTELATKATKRKADGTVEQWGLAGAMHTTMWRALIDSDGGTLSRLGDDGVPQLLLSDPIVMKALEQMYDWTVVKKIAYVNNGSQSWDFMYREFTKGNIAMLAADNNFLTIARDAGMVDDFGVLLPPKGPDVDDYVLKEQGGELNFIPKSYESMADTLLLIIDEIYAPLADDSFEDVVAERVATLTRDEQSLNNYVRATLEPNMFAKDDKDVDFSDMLDIWWTTPSINEMMNEILNGQTTPGEAVSAYSNRFQTSIRDSWGDMQYTGK